MKEIRIRNYYIRFLLGLALIVQGCSTTSRSNSATNTDKVPVQGLFAIRDVTVIPMTPENKIIEHATVLVKGNKIAAINGAIPDSAEMIDGKGKWLIPGLIDMHVHNLAAINFGTNYPTKGASFFMNDQDFMLLYVANGVTTAFELSGRAEHFGQRNEIRSGAVIGPRIALAALIDGGNGSGMIANTPADGRQIVRVAKGMGYEFIKVYSSLDIETYRAIVDEAKKQSMKVVGHIPNAFKGRLEEAFVPNFDLVAHAEEYAKQTDDFSDRDARRFARLAQKNGTWLSPTLITMVRIAQQARTLDSIRSLKYLSYVHPLVQSKWLTSNQYNRNTSADRVAYFEKLNAFHIRLVKAFKEAQVPIVAGTDAGTSGVVWGYSLHDELELLVKAGLTPAEALAAATRLPAAWLQISDKTGTIEEGKFADLVLLDANPMIDIRNTRSISGAFFDGRWIKKEQINRMLSVLAEKNKSDSGKYEWSERNKN
ncbi:amidohydrolase family protein [Niabella beijingensis]|uniref:amidohydrolase family protein n=1 Tax=Niabella beijingensis TaxID=2872700 RepID=UPI001CBAE2EB|nr:amidohydrolase family protein [Niabella beijingensis]MBZ4192606.1 amidohydrolase family protein [Niabella beijingensis]